MLSLTFDLEHQVREVVVRQVALGMGAHRLLKRASCRQMVLEPVLRGGTEDQHVQVVAPLLLQILQQKVGGNKVLRLNLLDRHLDLRVETFRNGLKYHLAARRTLERAMRAHPKSYIPYYNLAYLMFKLEDEGPRSARQYYELGRALGGPKDPKLESRLK